MKKILLATLLLIASSAQAQPQLPEKLPPTLDPWVEWVRAKHPEWSCARNNGAYACVWPGAAKFDIGEKGAAFTVNAELLAEGEVMLPSGNSFAPSEISVKRSGSGDVSPQLFTRENGVSVELPKGSYEISGRFSWSEIPPQIPLPSQYGRLKVNFDSNLKSFYAQREESELWIKERKQDTSTMGLSLTVMRRISDGSPLLIESLLRLRVSGDARPLQLGKILPKGSRPVSAQSSLPFHITDDGTLALQLAPGEHTVEVLSVLAQPVETIALDEPNREIWPKDETWSWVPDTAFRSVEVTGGQAIHGDLTELPDDWKSGANYIVHPGEPITLKEMRRGEQAIAPNEINLSRELWIDLSGDGFTAVDQFSGTVSQKFRLNALPQTQLGRAQIDGTPSLISKDPASGENGVELRRQALSVNTVSRIEDTRTVSAIGWNTTVNSLSLLLHLPPSWKLMFVSGVPEASGSWLDSWTLLDVFITILLTISAYKLFGTVAAALLGTSLVLNHGEFLAPQMLFIYIMGFLVWRSLVTDEKSSWSFVTKILLAVTLAAWGLQALAFVKLQLTQAIFPQLQAGTRYRTVLQELLVLIEGSLLIWPFLLGMSALVIFALRSIAHARTIWGKLGRLVLWGIAAIILLCTVTPVVFEMAYTSKNAELADYSSMPASKPAGIAGGRFDAQRSFLSEQELPAPQAAMESVEDSVAQAPENKSLVSGPAIPSWRWRSSWISLPGPIGPDYTVSFVLLPPIVNRILCALRSLLLLILAFVILRHVGWTEGLKRFGRARGTAAAALLLFIFSATPARADVPSDAMLEDLESRMQAELCQENSCSALQEVTLQLSADTFRIQMKASSKGISSVSLPGPLEVLAPSSVKVNGKESIALRRVSGDFLEIRTEPGTNTIEAEGPLPAQSAFSVQFRQRPLFSKVTAADWIVEGISPTGAIPESLRFTSRASQQGDSPEDYAKTPVLPTWVTVKRSIKIGEQVLVTGTVTRIGSTDSEAHVKVPLYPAEQVTSGGIASEGGNILISLPPKQTEAHFRSTLPYTADLKWKAHAVAGVTEEWLITCDSFVACNQVGLTPTHSIVDGKRAWLWQPFPGEEVTINTKLLEGVSGEFITVDSTTHAVRWGASSREGTINVVLRATQQAPFTVSAPPETQITKVSVNGDSGTGTISGLDAQMLLHPGEHRVEVVYTSTFQPEFMESVPAITLTAPVHNLSVEVSPAPDRWLLWTGGGSWGPCVIFWAKLLFIIVICLGLQINGLLKSSRAGAVFLAIGLTTIPVILLIIPLTWLVVLNIHEKLIPAYRKLPRPVSLTIFVGLTLLSLAILYQIVEIGLVLEPPMLVVGNGSNSSLLKWYFDHADQSALPQPWIISLPMWYWRTFSIAWATWLVIALLRWLKDALEIFRKIFAERAEARAA